MGLSCCHHWNGWAVHHSELSLHNHPWTLHPTPLLDTDIVMVSLPWAFSELLISGYVEPLSLATKSLKPCLVCLFWSGGGQESDVSDEMFDRTFHINELMEI